MSTQPPQPVPTPIAGPLSRGEIAEKVVGVIASTKQLPAEAVRPESTLEELGIDSLDRLNILFDLEGAFNISINDEQARQVRTVAEMTAGIEHLVTGAAAREEASGAPLDREMVGDVAMPRGGEAPPPARSAAAGQGASVQAPPAERGDDRSGTASGR